VEQRSCGRRRLGRTRNAGYIIYIYIYIYIYSGVVVADRVGGIYRGRPRRHGGGVGGRGAELDVVGLVGEVLLPERTKRGERAEKREEESREERGREKKRESSLAW
jgi:hypothetical protein